MLLILSALTCGCGTDSSVSSETADTNSTIEEASDDSSADNSAADNTADSDSSSDGIATDDAADSTDDGASSDNSDTSVSDEAVGEVGFYVDGTEIMDANGNPFVMRGINHTHSWFSGQDITALDAIAATGANTVRIVCADGVQWTADTTKGMQRLIGYCMERNMICILEVHDATGYNDIDAIQSATNFWIWHKEALIGYEDYVILNIANEWVGDNDADTWAEGYCTVIPQLREAGIENLIMVDAPGWGQYGEAIAEKGAEVLASDPDGNTMFSIHMYSVAGGEQEHIESLLTDARDRGLAVCVGEFGCEDDWGDVDEDYIIQYCTEQGIGYLPWCWKCSGEETDILDLTVDWAGSELTPDWGEKIINGEYGIRNTSVMCTVFE